MNLSFSTRGWGDLSWDELIDAALDMKFTGIEVYNLFKFPEMTQRGGPFHKHKIAATVRQLRDLKLKIPCLDTSLDISDAATDIALITDMLKTAHDLQVPYVVNSGNTISATAHLKLHKQDKVLEGVSIGDGPIDAAFLAVESITGQHYELDDFQIQAVTEGREAMGQTVVKLRSGGKVYSGRGISTDIVGASIRAYINALNKIVYEEETV